MKITRATVIIAAAFAFATQAHAVDISGNIAYATDYLYDGLSQTGNDGAIQAGLNVASDSGIYFSTWASQVDFGAICGDNFDENCKSDFETDWLIGYSGGDEAFSYDFGYAYYKYFATGDGYDYSEIYASVTFAETKISLYHSNDFAGTGIKNNRVKVLHTFSLNDHWTIPVELGQDRFNETFDFGGAFDKSFVYYRAAVGYTMDNWYAEAAYIRTNLDVVDGADADMFSADGNVVFSVSYSFGAN